MVTAAVSMQINTIITIVLFLIINLHKNHILYQKNKELNVEEYNKIKKFIENEIVDKEFYAEKIFDAGFDVIVNYKGTRKRIQNNKGVKDKLKIYDKVQILINELLEND